MICLWVYLGGKRLPNIALIGYLHRGGIGCPLIRGESIPAPAASKSVHEVEPNHSPPPKTNGLPPVEVPEVDECVSMLDCV